MPYVLGDDLPVFETPWGNVGMLICHDRWYPENARTLAHRGATLVLNPTATGVFHPKSDYFEIHRSVLRSHAYLNQLWWASCNAGNHGAHSVIISPMGSIAAEAGDGEQVLIHRIRLREGEGYDFRSNLRDGLYA